MKVGDRVKSDQWDVEGYVQEFQPCIVDKNCPKMSLSLEPSGMSSRVFYHVDLFTVIPEEVTND